MLCTYFTSYRVVSLRAAWVTFHAPGLLDRDPYGIHTSSLSNNNNSNNNNKDRNNHILQRAPTGGAASALMTVLEAILTGRQTWEKL